MTLVKRLVKGSELTYAEGDGNLDHFDGEINELQGAQVVSGSGTGMVFSRRGRVQFPYIGDGVTDCATDTTNLWTSLQGTGKILKYEAGEYLNSGVYPTLTGFYIECEGLDTILTSTRKTGGVITISGDGGIEGGIWQHKYGRQFNITAMSVSGNVCTCTCPGHPYSASDVVNIRCSVTVDANGDRTITGVSGDNFTFALTHANATATIPYSRNDLYNTGTRAIYPFAQMPRLDDTTNIFTHTAGGTYHLRDLMMRGTRQSGLLSYSGRAFLHNLQVWEGASDGLHFTGGTQDVTCTGLIYVRRVEEANFAVIGYRKNAVPIARISVQTLDVGDQLAHGAGLDLTGVIDFSCERLIATNIYGSGIRMLGAGSPYWTFGNRNVRIGHATLNSCGCYGTVVPAGWENNDLPSVWVDGASPSEPERQVFGVFDHLEIVNSRWRPITDSGPSTLEIGQLSVYGGYIGPTVVTDCRDWIVGRASFDEIPETALTLGDATAAGINRFGPIKMENVNAGVPVGIASASCDGTTVTIITDTAHGMSGTPIFQISGIESATTNVDGAVAKAAQDKDYALNGNWMPMPTNWVASTNYAIHDRRIASAAYISGTPAAANFYFEVVFDGGSAGSTEPTWTLTNGAFTTDGNIMWCARALSGVDTYTGITYPDTVTISITGSGKVATSSPRVYSPSSSIPKARLRKGATSSNDCIQVDSGSAGTPQGTFILEDVQLLEQWFPIDRLVFSGTTGAARLRNARDWSYQTLPSLTVDGSALPSFNRYCAAPHIGVPFSGGVTGSTIYVTRVYIDRPEATITKLGFRMTVAETGADAYMGLYSPESVLLASGEFVNAFTGSAGDKEINVYHRIIRPGWYFLALNTNCATTGEISWHYIDASVENRMRSGAVASTTDMGWTAAELAASLAAAADFAAFKTAVGARTPAPDYRLTQALAYGAMPATLTLARSNGVTEPHLWLRTT